MIEELRRAFRRARLRQADVSRRIAVSQKHLSQVLLGHVPLSVPLALRLEQGIPGLDAEHLMVLQAREQVRKARVERSVVLVDILQQQESQAGATSPE